MRAWWRRRSRRTKARLVFYPSFVAALGGAAAWMIAMPGRSHRGPLPPLDAQETALRDALRADVLALAGAIGERNVDRRGTLAKSAAFLDEAFAAAGHAPRHVPYDVDGATVENLEAVLEGAARPREIVVVGAHYDSAPSATGADDDASGVAAMLALARAFARSPQPRTIRFVAFVNEEPPYFWTPSMGSLVYAKACKARGDDVVAMLSLETLGYYSDDPGSQKYPPIVRWFYPDTGDFVGFVGDLGSRSLVRESVRTFRGAVRFPSEGAALPSFVQGVGWSDQWSFWQVGYPGVMVTDTAPFRNPHYHTPGDVPATLDYDRLARVVHGLEAVVRTLAE